MANEPHSLRVEGVVLSHREMGEADRLLVIYTREHGKLRAIAKGVRKLHSRKAGHLQPFSRAKIMLARGRDLWIVTQAEVIDASLLLQENLESMAYALYVIELLDRFTYEEGANPALYQLLVKTLHRLAEAAQPEMVLRFYDLRLLDLMGFRPQLFNCVGCGNVIKAEDQYFSAVQGGVLCPRCGHDTASAQPVSMHALKYLRHFQRSRYEAAMRAPYHPGILKEMDQVLQYYFLFLLERHLNTPGFIHRVQHEHPEPDQGLGDSTEK
ncbi:MAG: DNA repair protein RecO [Anaerolineae bacterium]|nr:DNA repair protein RecO [Anaerolineae bacterium]